MESISNLLKKTIGNIISDKYGLSDIDITILPTRKEFVGSHTYTLFQVSKLVGKSPDDIGKEIIGELVSYFPIKSFNIIKGFLNIEFSDYLWANILERIGKDNGYGNIMPNGKTVLVEYSSPNTNKPLHLGHLRNNFLGHAIANILKANGYNVTKVNLINDRGIHICKSMAAYIRFGNNEIPDPLNMKGDHLVGKYYVKFNEADISLSSEMGLGEQIESPIMIEARGLLEKWEKNDPDTIELWQKMNSWVYDGFDVTYKKLGITFDKTYFESKTYLLGKDIVKEGLEKGVFYKKEEDDSIWAKLDDIGLGDKLVLRGNGTSVYITQDLGTADLKFSETKFDKSIYVVGSEQDHHFRVLFEILKRLGREYSDNMYHLSYGMVELPNGRMKSREGTVVDADDLIAEMVFISSVLTAKSTKVDGYSVEELMQLSETIGIGALKYYLLKVDPKKKIMFDPEDSIKLQGNTAPYIQYSYARIKSILSKSEWPDPEKGITWDVTNMLGVQEIELIELLEKYPEAIHMAGENYDPSEIAKFCYELAKSFNRYYTEIPVLTTENKEQLSTRLYLLGIVARTLKQAMFILGIEVPEKM